MVNKGTYRGRFAPSPTGPLHFGSLLAALGSYLQARSRYGEWLVRMEDIDPPREVAGAADAILRTLEAYGLYWDGTVLYQSRRSEAYLDAIETLLRTKRAYHCTCSRKAIAEYQSAHGRPGHIYPGLCRTANNPSRPDAAIRVNIDGTTTITFTDRLQGEVLQNLRDEVGDFVIRRADGLFAYQLAVVVDDAAQGITEVVRGSDLLDSTPRQIFLQQSLNLPTPHYLHLPVAVNEQGQKLSKQTFAPALDDKNPLPTLITALAFLGQKPTPELAYASVEELLQWATRHWRPNAIPARLGIAFYSG